MPALAPEKNALLWTPHPVLPVPSREQIVAGAAARGITTAEFALAVWQKREEAISLEKSDPLRHGFEPPTTKKLRALLATHDEILLMGANRIGKSTDAAKLAVEDLVAKPRRIWAFFHSSEQSSINQQQSLIYRFLPPEWRSAGRQGVQTYVKYAQATGFANFKFILPNGSTGLFFNYKQDVSVFEGYELDGVWFDELVPQAFVDAMQFRVGQGRKMKLLLTFTPVHGYFATVGTYLAGAEVVESRPIAPEFHEQLKPDVVHVRGCPPGHMPYVMRCRNPKSAVLFYHWGMNPYGANAEVLEKLHGAPSDKVKIRAYGYAPKPSGGAFAKYGPVHRISRAKFHDIEKKGGTRYCVADPGGTKNWFIKWYFVTPQQHVIVYREWPDEQRHGEWALPADRADFRAGPAQRSEAGRGMRDYKRLILELEGWFWDTRTKKWDDTFAEKIHLRLIDPRMGGATVPGAEDGTSIIALMEEEHVDKDGTIHAPRMFWEAAPASRVEETVQMINDRLDYNEEQPVNVLNCPTWYFVDDLKQSDLAYREYTGLGTEKDALKDIIDPDRYFVKAELGHLREGRGQPRRGGSY